MKKYIAIIAILISLLSCNKDENKDNGLVTRKLNSSKEITKVIVATGKVEPELGIIKIAAPVDGIVKEIIKKEGDFVDDGETLLQLVDEIEKDKVDEISSEIITQKTQIKIAETQVEEVEINLANKIKQLEKARRLIVNGAETQQNLEDITKEIDIYKANLARENVKVAQAKQKVNELLSRLQTAKHELNRKSFKSFSSGTVLSCNLKKGEAIKQYTEYLEFAPAGNLIVKAQVDELFSAKVRIGQKVQIVKRGSDEIISKGQIVKVSPYLKKKSIFTEKIDEQEDRRIREIKISLENSENLIINSLVDCKIIISGR